MLRLEPRTRAVALFSVSPCVRAAAAQLASSYAVIGNLREAVLFHREAAALHVRAHRPEAALGALADAERAQRQSGPLVPPSLPLGELEAAAGAEEEGETSAAPPSPSVAHDCTLDYWRGRAMLALGRRAEAADAFAAVGVCEDAFSGGAAIRAAAAAEREQTERALRTPIKSK